MGRTAGPARDEDAAGGFVRLQGDLGGFEPGDSVRVEGIYLEYSTQMRSVIQIEKISRR